MSELLPSADDVYTGPDAAGFFGSYGGAFVPETVIPALQELTAASSARVTPQTLIRVRRIEALKRDHRPPGARFARLGSGL